MNYYLDKNKFLKAIKLGIIKQLYVDNLISDYKVYQSLLLKYGYAD